MDLERPASLRQIFKSSLRQLPCCFPTRQYHGGGEPSAFYGDATSPWLALSPSSWRKPVNGQIMPESKDEAKNHRLRFGKHKRRHSSVDLHYDAVSYSMNFDEGGANVDKADGESQSRNFISRLPASPQRRAHAIT